VSATTARLDDLRLALAAAWEAGELLLRAFGTGLEVRHKGVDDPVTDADLEADALLARRLTGARPGDGWLSEETLDRPDRLARRRVWIVDPLDGTRSFLRGYGEFAVSVALVEAGAVGVGVVYNPARRDLFWAVRGLGAHRVTGWEGPEAPGLDTPRLVAGGAGDGLPALVASRSEIRLGEFERFDGWRIEPLGSTAYKLAVVAGGGAEGYVSRGPKSEWDVAAGVLILSEAGGVVTDVAGRLLQFNRPDPYVHGVVAAPPARHAELLKLIAGLRSPRLEARGEPDPPGGEDR
jgi:myo-inositol-1(or 4)-monophosphatase